jgi:glycosyltransferase involved in cell wall biosynthesis
MLKVAQIAYSGLGGHGSVAFSLLDADKGAEWQPSIGFIGVERLSSTYAKACEDRRIAYAYFAARPGRSWMCWPSIFRWLTRTQPDAIIVHSIKALLPCFMYRWKRGVPVLAVEHEPNVLKRWREWFVSLLAMQLANHVVVLTPEYDLELRKKLSSFYRSNKVRIIPNGIDISRFIPGDCSRRKPGVVRLGMAARFVASKRQDILVDMIAELRKREPDIDWQLTLAGDGETWESVKNRVRERQVDGSLALPGRLGENELSRWFQSIDIYVHASEGEALSTALLQAMACRLPIVASDVPGIRNLLLQEKVCGLLVEGQNPSGFASAVARIVKEPARADALGEAGRGLAENRYSQSRMFAEYSALLTSTRKQSSAT